jgi:hypothetical protein
MLISAMLGSSLVGFCGQEPLKLIRTPLVVGDPRASGSVSPFDLTQRKCRGHVRPPSTPGRPPGLKIIRGLSSRSMRSVVRLESILETVSEAIAQTCSPKGRAQCRQVCDARRRHNAMVVLTLGTPAPLDVRCN